MTIVDKFQNLFLEPEPTTRFPPWFVDSSFSEKLLDDVELELRNRYEFRENVLSSNRRSKLIEDLDAALRLVMFYLSVDLPGVAVLGCVRNGYDAYPIFDVFSARARGSISLPEKWSDWFTTKPVGLDGLKPWVQEVAGTTRDILIAEPRTAVRGFLALFIDTIRVAGQASSASTAGTVNFTLHSLRSGYSVDYYPQYRYAPVSFGSKPTTPVKGRLPVGHYYFQGWQNNQVVRDPRVHFAGPNSTSAHVQAF
ncbi:MAG TPA: hypothetical protein VIF02_13310 [Methylocella sp.]